MLAAFLTAWGSVASAADLSDASRSIVDLVPAAAGEVAQQAIDLELGKSIFVRTGFSVRRVSVGDPGIIDVVVLSTSELQIVPKKIGETNMIVWERGGEPTVIIDISVGTSFTTLERRLRTVLDTDTINVETFGNSVALTGTVVSPVIAERALSLANAYFKSEGGDGKDEGPSIVSALQVGGNQQVMIEVIVAEMSKSVGKRLNVNWSTIVETGMKTYTFQNFLGELVSLDDDPESNGVLVQNGVDFIGSFIDPGDFAVDYFVEAAIDNALAKVLAKPTLMSRSGQTANVLVGGEIPIPVTQGGNSDQITVVFKTFGISVEFTPTVLGPDRINLEVAPEVSEPDFTIGTTLGGLRTPGFVTRRASTNVELGDGQSFAIAGLLSDQTNEFIEKYPILGDIPILGALFRSTDYMRQETELVIIVTPRLVKPLPEGPPPLPTDYFVDPNTFELFLLGAMESQRTHTAPGASASLIGPSGHRVPTETENNEQ